MKLPEGPREKTRATLRVVSKLAPGAGQGDVTTIVRGSVAQEGVT